MGWKGNFTLKYEGNKPKDFLKLAKMLIPNSLMRFDFDSCKKNTNSVELYSTRGLKWYSADEDMKRLVSYLPDGDSVFMEIESYGENEEIRISNEKGKVIFCNSNAETDRYGSEVIGIPEMLYEEHSPGYAQESPEIINICSIDGYIQLIANTFANDEKLMPIVQEFMYEVLDIDKINSYAWGEEFKLVKEDCDKIEKLRNVFSTVDSTRAFLKQQKVCSVSERKVYKQSKYQKSEDYLW